MLRFPFVRRPGWRAQAVFGCFCPFSQTFLTSAGKGANRNIMEGPNPRHVAKTRPTDLQTVQTNSYAFFTMTPHLWNIYLRFSFSGSHACL